MNLDAGAEKQFTTELHDNQPEKNNNVFFIKLYNTEFEDLSFTFEYDYIHFADGEYYHGDLD